jgi:hypothetical protein
VLTSGKSVEDKKRLLDSRDEVVKFSKLKNPVLRCPVYGCPQFLKPIFNSKTDALQSHIQRCHKELIDAGVEISETGKLKIPSMLVDNALRMCNWQKKFVNGTSVKQEAEKCLKALEQKSSAMNGHNMNGQNGSGSMNGVSYAQN